MGWRALVGLGLAAGAAAAVFGQPPARPVSRRDVRAVWCDIGSARAEQLARSGELARLVQEWGLTDVIVTVQDLGDRAWSLNYSAAQRALVSRAIADAGARPHAMLWPRPAPEWVASLMHNKAGLLRDFHALQLDVEENWTVARLAGYPSLDAAENDIVRVLEGNPWSITIHGGRIPSKLVSAASWTYMQAYSVDNEPDRGWGERFGPQRIARAQSTALAEAMAGHRSMPGVVWGLAAWAQSAYPPGPFEAMRTAWQSAREVGGAGCCWWSLRHILDPSRPYARQFMRESASWRWAA